MQSDETTVIDCFIVSSAREFSQKAPSVSTGPCQSRLFPSGIEAEAAAGVLRVHVLPFPARACQLVQTFRSYGMGAGRLDEDAGEAPKRNGGDEFASCPGMHDYM